MNDYASSILSNIIHYHHEQVFKIMGEHVVDSDNFSKWLCVKFVTAHIYILVE